MPKLWSYAVGEYGYRVQVRERYPGSNLYLFRWDGQRRNWRKTSLRHRDKERAKHEARVAASRRLADAEEVRSGATSLGAAIRLFLFHEGQDFSLQRYKEMEAWRDLWITHLGPRKPIGQIDRSDLKGYLRDRQRSVA